MKLNLVRLMLCAAALSFTDAAFSQQSGPSDPSQIFRSASPSVVTISVGSPSLRQGSGVAIGSSYDKAAVTGTWVVTNAHVVGADRNGLRVRESGQMWPAKVEYQDAKSDLALLHVPGLKLPTMKPYGVKTLDVGSRVYAVGSPLGLDRSLSEGIVSAIRREQGTVLVQTTAAISPGSSGGALIDEHARLVGITTFKLREGESLNFAVDAARVEEIQSAIRAARLFQAVYERKAVRVGSEEEKDVAYIESDALTEWMLDALRSDGSPNYSWFNNRLDASMRTDNKFWGGNPAFEAFQAEFLSTRPRGAVAKTASDPKAAVVRLSCRMLATSDGSFQFDLAVAFDIAKGIVNGLPARITPEEIVFRTGKGGAFTATINRFSLLSRIGNEERPNLLNGTCTRVEDRKF